MTREMKDSGIEWIGYMPQNWEIKRISQVYDERKQKVSDKDYPPLSVTMQGIVPQLSNAAKTDAHDDRKLVLKGDFAINSRSDRRGSCGVSNYDGSVSLINTILKPQKEMNPIFYNWLFHSSMFSDEFYKWGHGIVDDLWTTNWDNMKRISIPYPPLSEQQQIADFLDEKISKIDEVLEKTKQSIEEYKKLKQAVITQAVTKGLDSDVKMKDSGIEWIGDIPTAWKLEKVKFNSKTRNQKYDVSLGKLDYFALENVIGWNNKLTSTDNEYELDGSLLCKKNDVVFGKLRPYLAKTFLVDYDRCCSSEFAVFYDFKGIPKYFLYLFTSYGFVYTVNRSTVGTKMPRANINFINNLIIPIPPLAEQEEIVNYLDKKVLEVDILISKKEQLIKELESYKKSLIYDYVTGKKEVLI